MKTLQNDAVLTDVVGTTFGSKRVVRGSVATAAALAMDCDEDHVSETVQFIPKQYTNRATAVIARARLIHKGYTSPWDDKARLCAVDIMPILKSALKEPIDELEKLAIEMRDKHGDILAAARAKIRNDELWQRFTFPTPYELESSYSITLNVSRIPDGDPRTQLASQSVIDEIVSQEQKRVSDAIGGIGSTVVVRLDKMVFRVLSKLRTTGSQWQKSMIEDIREWCPIFESMATLANDQQVVDLIRKIHKEMGFLSVDSIRFNESERNRVIDLSTELLRLTSSTAKRLGFSKQVDEVRRAFNREEALAEERKAKKDPAYRPRNIDVDAIHPEDVVLASVVVVTQPEPEAPVQAPDPTEDEEDAVPNPDVVVQDKPNDDSDPMSFL